MSTELGTEWEAAIAEERASLPRVDVEVFEAFDDAPDAESRLVMLRIEGRTRAVLRLTAREAYALSAFAGEQFDDAAGIIDGTFLPD